MRQRHRICTPSLRAQRSNPDRLHGSILDCFVARAPRNDDAGGARTRHKRRHFGAMRSIEPGIWRFRVRSCGPPRNDSGCVERAGLSAQNAWPASLSGSAA
ncbi:hypothetical protein XH89_08460 [Bradyrhizobium sp. CCBAU 53340]|nr:hypothetical protein XH89_08460 [Bradyrhizobium sp. CCBAU 53340]